MHLFSKTHALKEVSPRTVLNGKMESENRKGRKESIGESERKGEEERQPSVSSNPAWFNSWIQREPGHWSLLRLKEYHFSMS